MRYKNVVEARDGTAWAKMGVGDSIKVRNIVYFTAMTSSTNYTKQRIDS